MLSAHRGALGAAILALSGSLAAGETYYVSSDFSHEVLRYDGATGAFIDVFVSAGSGGLDQPHGILHRGADVLVCSFGTDQVLRYDATTGAFLGVFIDAATGLDDPVYLVPGSGGALLISSQASDEILRFASDGAPLGPLVTAGAGGLDGPSGFAVGQDGRLYVAGRYSANVLAFDASTGVFLETILDSTDGLGAGDTFGLQLAGADQLYVASNSAVHQCDLASGAVIDTIPMAFPIGLERTASGDVLAASSNNLFHIDTDNANALTGPILSGGAINVLNFFHLVPTPGACAGDVDGDGDTDVFDFAELASNFGAGPGATPEMGDLNGDGFVNVFDFSELAADFGCANAP